MLFAAQRAFVQIFSPSFRSVLLKSLALTIGLVIGVGVLAGWAINRFVTIPWHWVDTVLAVVSGLGLAVGMTFLIPTVCTLFAGLFLDEVAEAVEAEDYPNDPPGKPMSISTTIGRTVRFTGVVILGNILALLLLLVPGINIVAFFVVNGYLLGRDYFETVGMRFRSEAEAVDFRRENQGVVFLGGLLISALTIVPILNLIAPMYATAFMTHLYKYLAAREAAPLRAPR